MINPASVSPVSAVVEAAAFSKQEIYAQLQEAFQTFTEASARFEEHYGRLERCIADLNLELEEANAKLRRNLEEKQKVQEYLSTLLESLPVGVVGTGPDGRIHSCNRGAADILERLPGEIVGGMIGEMLEWEGGIVSDGKPGSKPEKVESWEHALHSALQQGAAVEFTFLGAQTSRRRILRLRAVRTNPPEPSEGREEGLASNASEPDRDSAIQAVFLLEDVTEVRRLEHQAQRNGRLAAMGEIAMNVAHEIRNPLGSIELFASMLQRDLADDPQKNTLARHISAGVRCVDHIVANILQFARPQRLICSEFELRDLIEDTLLFAEHALRQKGIRVERAYSNASTLLCADAELLKQMFLNLFLNAIHATPEGGTVGVETIPNGKTVEARIWDTGCGLSPAIMARIFDPFFTTRRKGTGLGLTIVHNIVSVHEGSIEAENRPGGGALFSIVLPRRGPNHPDIREMRSALESPAGMVRADKTAGCARSGSEMPISCRKEIHTCPPEC